MLYGLAIFIFVIVCIMLMGIIILQSSKTRGRRRAVPALQFERLGTPRRDDGVRYTL